MFENVKGYSPVSQDFIWLADYYNGYLSEFDFDTKHENSFYNIEKNRLQRFGLLGNGMKMWFECYRGSFNVNGRIYDVAYKNGDKLYMLTGQDVFQRDIITYKKAYADLKLKGKAENKIVAYYFGYKSELNIDDIKFNFKPIVVIPLNKPVHFKIHLVANRDMNGSILIKKNGKFIEDIPAPIKANVGGELTWVVR